MFVWIWEQVGLSLAGVVASAGEGFLCRAAGAFAVSVGAGWAFIAVVRPVGVVMGGGAGVGVWVFAGGVFVGFYLMCGVWSSHDLSERDGGGCAGPT